MLKRKRSHGYLGLKPRCPGCEGVSLGATIPLYTEVVASASSFRMIICGQIVHPPVIINSLR